MRRMTRTNRVLLPVSLKTRILLSFLLVILVLSVPTAVLGYRVIQKNIIRRADRQVRRQHQCGAEIVYTGEIERIGEALKLVPPKENVEALKERAERALPAARGEADFGTLRSEIARVAVQRGKPVGGTRIVSRRRAGGDAGRVPGQGADRDQADAEGAADRQEGAQRGAWPRNTPCRSSTTREQVQAVLYGGRVVNRDYTFVDRVREMVFGKEIYKVQARRHGDDLPGRRADRDERAGQARAAGHRHAGLGRGLRGRGRAGADLARAGLRGHRLLQDRLRADPGYPRRHHRHPVRRHSRTAVQRSGPAKSSSSSCCRSAA